MFYEEVIGKRQVTAVNLPDNMTKYYHVLDLTVTVKLLQKKCIKSYAKEIHLQSNAGIQIEGVM